MDHILHPCSEDSGLQRAAQLLAARGYIVFSPNYRGSDHRGNAYQRAIYNDAGDGPGRDVMAALKALERRSFIDTSRIPGHFPGDPVWKMDVYRRWMSWIDRYVAH